MSLYPLYRELSDGQLHSGNALALTLDLSRNAIWKQIKQLEKSGLSIQHLPRKGYQLVRPIELLDTSSIQASLSSNLALMLDWKIPSTQTQALEYFKAHQKACVSLCEWQTAGKGRRGRSWQMIPGESLVFSISLALNQSIHTLQSLPIDIVLTLLQQLQSMGFESLKLKWPNDIVIEKNGQIKKIAGLLTQAETEMNGQTIVTLGVGINLRPPVVLNQFIDQAFAGLSDLTHSPVARNELAAHLIQVCMDTLTSERQSIANRQSRYEYFDVLAGKTLTVQTASARLTGYSKGIDEYGQLLFQPKDSKNSTLMLSSAEVQVRPQ